MRRPLFCFLALVIVTVAHAQTPVSAPVAENLTRFDYQRAELRRADDGWQLVANGQTLKHFPREAEARQALKLMHDLRLTQHATIGAPQPVIEYWLADGQAPRGLVRGLRLTPLDPNTMRAEQVREQWVVRDDRQMHFLFGAQEDEAKQAAAVIRRYGFNQVGYVGLETPSMMYFLVHHNNKDDAQIVTPTSTGEQPGKPQSVLPIGATQPQVQGQLPKNVAKTPAAFTSQPVVRQLTTPSLTAAKTIAPVERLPFDWRTVQVKRDGNDWKLVSGSQTLAHFGRSEREAKQALTVMQRYRFTEFCTVGKPKPACSYYLVYGQAPRGLHIGVSSVSFRPEALTVQERDGTWSIIEGNRTLLPFGPNEADARQMLQVIQQQKFDHWCHVGRSGQGGMTFFARAR